MSVVIKIDRAARKAATNAAADKAAAAVAERMMNDSIDIIPKQEGPLRDSGRILKENPNERVLSWGTGGSYAGYQWFGMREDGTNVVENYTTPGTGKMWVEQAKASHGDVWDKVAQNAFEDGLK